MMNYQLYDPNFMLLRANKLKYLTVVGYGGTIEKFSRVSVKISGKYYMRAGQVD